jgi:hypothetical protein
MSDAMIVSRLIIGARCSEATARALGPPPEGAVHSFCVFQTTASRGDRVRRVLCCWSGGRIAADPEFTPVGLAAFEALMRLPSCMDDHPAVPPIPVIQQLIVGRTPLRDKIIDAVLEAPPGARLCFLGDLAGELDGLMSPAFNFADSEPITLDDDGRPA